MIRQRTIARRLRDAQPKEPDDWAESPEGRAVLAGVLDSPRQDPSPSASRLPLPLPLPLPGPRRRRPLAVAVVAVVAAAGAAAVVLVASGLLPGHGGSQPDHAPDLSILATAGGSGDNVVVADSPKELVAKVNPDVIVVGAVEGIDQGPDIDIAGSPDPMHQIVVRVRVDQTLRPGKPGQIDDGHVYLTLYQGPIYEDTGKPSVTLQDWSQAIPTGTRVMLFAGDWGPTGDDRVENADRGHPSGSQLLAAIHQGMIFEYNGKIIDWDREQGPETSTWNVQSIDDIATQVKTYLKTHG